MNKSKIRIICIVMVLTMVVLGVVAFADGTKESREIKEQSSESVKIEQIEQERKDASQLWLGESNLQQFTQYGALNPAKYADGYGWIESDTSGLWMNIEGARDKIVTVANRGESNVYFRTIIAMETNPDVENLVKMNLNTKDYDWNQEADGTEIAVIEDVDLDYTYNSGEEGAQDYVVKGKFDIIVGIYNQQIENNGTVTYDPVLSQNEVSTPSLLQVAMDKNATEAQIKKLGATYEILVWSQAAAAGDESDPVTALAAKFGKISYDNHPWKQFNALEDSSKTSAADTDDDTSPNDDN